MEIKYVNDNGEVRWQPVDKWGRPIQRQSGAGTVLQGGGSRVMTGLRYEGGLFLVGDRPIGEA